MTSPVDNTIGTDGRQHYAITFAVLAAGSLIFSLLQSLVSPALPAIQHDLDTSSTAVAWLLTGYLLSASVFTPIIGRLGDMFGKERTLVIVLIVLAAGTALSAVAASIWVMIAGRVIQGAGGAIFPLAFGIVRDEFPRQRVAQGIALISAMIGIGGGLGIVLAGPIVDALSYHWLFWLPLVLIVGVTIVTAVFVPESPVKVPGRVNWAGAALLTAWMVCLLLGVTQGATWGWGDPRVLALFAAGVVLLIAWVRNEQRAEEPLIDMRMMRIRGVWTANAAAFTVGAGMYSAFVLLPEFTETPSSAGYGFGASVTEAGLFMLPSTIMMLLCSLVAGRLAQRVGPRVPLIGGCVLACLAFTMMAVAHDERWQIYVASAVMGSGFGLSFSSLANVIVEHVRPDQTGVATGMNAVMRSIGGATCSTVVASLLAGTVVAGGLPTEGGFTAGFAVSAGACALAALASLAVPRRRATPSTVLWLDALPTAAKPRERVG